MSQRAVTDELNNIKTPATLTQPGIVQLNNAVDSNNETQAATPKAVKAAHDLANTANQNAATANNNANNANQNAANANDNANTRLEKSKNGADISDPKRFVENLGLDKTVRFKQSVIVGSDEKFLRLRADDGGAHADSAVDMFLWGDTSRGGERKTILEAKDKLGPLWWAHRLISDAVHFGVPGQIVPTNYDNFDSRYGGINTALKLTNGWWKCGDSGFIIQSGRISVGDNEVVTAKFPIPFPDECTSLVVTARSQVENADSDVLSAYGIAISQSHMRVSISTNFSGPVSGISFIAMGY
ncbi:phage tail protein [Xenorhabdus bovienii]|nr:phage tail protein [Xenorhabdus bovienii]MDE9477566.1 phage tail protein [Xenorhabdus bovienii]MDE9530443.1 phage tail protein [Xenorhabdus bovienii]